MQSYKKNLTYANNYVFFLNFPCCNVYWKTDAPLPPFTNILKKVHLWGGTDMPSTHGRPADDPRETHERATVGKRRGNLKNSTIIKIPPPNLLPTPYRTPPNHLPTLPIPYTDKS